jgi:hypothetical protein
MTEPHMLTLDALRAWIADEPDEWTPDRVRRVARDAAIERGINEASFAGSLLEALEEAQAEQVEPDPVVQVTCPACQGRGMADGRYCRTCFGRGRVQTRSDGV